VNLNEVGLRAFRVYLRELIEFYVIKGLFVLYFVTQLQQIYIVHTDRRNTAGCVSIYRLINVEIFMHVSV
jgi:hypothetical protein